MLILAHRKLPNIQYIHIISMTTFLSAVATGTSRTKSEKVTISLSRKTLFGSKSEEWHKLINCMAGHLQPSDTNFPYRSLKGQTDYYLKKKGRAHQKDIDYKLNVLLGTSDGDRKHIALAACAHFMSSEALREHLNAETAVTPVTYHGLHSYLQSLIAVHQFHPGLVGGHEAQVATMLIPYATTGTTAAGKYLEGLCYALRKVPVPILNPLPHLSGLTQRALQNFTLHLEGYKLECQWSSAYATTVWMSTLTVDPSAMPHSGHLRPEHLFDVHFPGWRAWAAWRPNMKRIDKLHKLNSELLCDLLALEGPDFITGRCVTLRSGFVSKFSGDKTYMRFQSLTIEVSSQTREELEDILDRLSAALAIAATDGPGPGDAFSKLCLLRPLTLTSLSLLEAFNRVSGPSKEEIRNSILDLWLNQERSGGQDISTYKCLIAALNTETYQVLENILVDQWFVKGLESCIQECQDEVYQQAGPSFICPQEWLETVVVELHGLLEEVKKYAPILPLLSETLQKQLHTLPTSATLKFTIEMLGSTRKALGPGTPARLSLAVKNSMLPWLVADPGEGFLDFQPFKTTQGWLSLILDVWAKATDPDRRTLAILCLRHVLKEPVRYRCLSQVLRVPDSFVKMLIDLLSKANADVTATLCTSFTRPLKAINDKELVDSWRWVLRKRLRDAPFDTVAYKPDSFTIQSWCEWVLDLKDLFSEDAAQSDDVAPTILRPGFLMWIATLSGLDHISTIADLEKALGPPALEAIRCLLERGDPPKDDACLSILKHLQSAKTIEASGTFSTVAGQLMRYGGNAEQVEKCMRGLLEATEQGLDACQRIVETVSDDSIPRVVSEVMLAGYREVEIGEELAGRDRFALKAVASVFSIPLHPKGIPRTKVEEAMSYFEQKEAELLQEANRLHDVKEDMVARDPTGTSAFLRQIGYPETSPFDQEFLDLPADIIDAVERHGEHVVEISFPLMAFTELQRAATGIGQANTLLAVLYLGTTRGKLRGFCVHLDTEASSEPSLSGSSWKCAELEHICERKTPLTWQLDKALQQYIKTSKQVEIAGIHGFIQGQLKNYAWLCLMCGQIHSSHNSLALRRPLTCYMCIKLTSWTTIPFDIRFPEIRNDPFVVDFLLTGVHAAASNNQLDLLPGCPLSIRNQIITILSKLPHLFVLQHAHNISAVLKDYHPDAEKLLTWVLSHYRGFIASATGILKIHGLYTGTHQFVLANANPQMEAAFAANISKSNPATRVLFHGTSIDRLPSILAKGLQVLSGTALQRTGAAYGNGIYLAEDPATSFGYSPSAISWPKSGLSNMRVLLGCEVIGDGNRVASGFHCIKDEKTVMLRYIFMLPPGGYAPVANHVVTPMLSAMTALRSRAV